MFTGIIESVGALIGTENRGGDQRFHINTGKLDLSDVGLGDSIAVNGVCLTVVALESSAFFADVSSETLDCTTLGEVPHGSALNLEKALLPTTRLGGHLVSGHVDGVGEIISMEPDARSVRVQVRAPQKLAPYIAAKGSICVDGISLTVNRVDGRVFDLNIVPHTLLETNLDNAGVGQQVNLEVDIIARYLERMLTAGRSGESEGVTPILLAEAGFIPQKS